MCGRFTLTSSPQSLESRFDLDETPELSPRFNIAPGQMIATVTASSTGSKNSLAMRRWGLIPSWAKDPKIGSRMINARAETVAEKPSFRSAFRKRRCLVPADGFYEWAAAGAGPKQPYHVARVDRAVLAFAGLWEHWAGADGDVIESCTLITTDANAAMKAIHARMPVILDPDDYGLWLDPAIDDVVRLGGLLRPLPDDALAMHPVSRRVNRPEFDDPSCIAPVEG